MKHIYKDQKLGPVEFTQANEMHWCRKASTKDITIVAPAGLPRDEVARLKTDIAHDINLVAGFIKPEKARGAFA